MVKTTKPARVSHFVMVTASQLQKVAKDKLQASHVEVEDTSGGCGQAFVVIVVSELFNGKNKLARARAVNQALQAEIAVIHAFTQKAYTPAEWEAKQSQ